MTDQPPEWRLADCNIPGVFAGLFLVVLPFLGYWWSVRFGDGAFSLDISPFLLGMYGFGKEYFSPLLSAVNTAVIITLVFFGALLFTGSVLRCSRQYRTQSDRLVRIAARKPIWMVLIFVIAIVIAGFGIQYSLRESGVDISLPVIAGDAVGIITVSTTTVEIPVSLSLNPPFWYALAAAILAVYAGIYQNRRHPGDQEDRGGDEQQGESAGGTEQF